MVVNILAYADDMIILAPSWYAMQDLLKILELHCHKLDIIRNTKKIVCMVFKPIRKDGIVSQAFPPFTLNKDGLCYVSEFRYLGHIINDRLQDDCDIRREIRSLFARTNLLISKFGNCSNTVKKLLFKTYCLCMYNLALWKYYTVTVHHKFKSCYNRCVKKFFRFQRRDSMSNVLIELSLPSADTVIHNSRVLFHNQYTMCNNSIVAWFVSIGI